MPNHATMDFETFSPAGFVWDEAKAKYNPLPGAREKGLPVVGASVYTEDPGAEILTLSYRLPKWWPGGGPMRRWRPGLPLPQDLFDYIAAGYPVEAHGAMFERLVWENIAVPKYGFPPLPPHLQRCSMAKARVNALPGKLAELSEVLDLRHKKDPEGKRLLDKFSIPRKPTKKDPSHRIRREDDPADAERLDAYCDRDVEAEEEASDHPKMVELSEAEIAFWLIDQEINHRGLGVDREAVRNCISVLNQALAVYGAECRALTGGLEPTQLEALKGWLAGRNCYMAKMDKEALAEALGGYSELDVPDEEDELVITDLPEGYISNEPPTAAPVNNRVPLPPDVRRVLEIRQLIGSASVKKLFAMENQASRDNRLRNLIVHHGARTGRPTGGGVQPLNMPRSGPDLKWCVNEACAQPFRPALGHCPWCSTPAPDKVSKWTWKGVEAVLSVMATRSLELVEWYFGDALLCISGCLRSLFVAAPGHELIASDYSAIEAVVTAMMAGEQWRIDTFRAVPKKDIYLVSAAKITGQSEEFYTAYAAANDGENHPDRQKIGKVAELAMGFGGWIGAWRAFDKTDNFTDDQVKGNILGWRGASPAIVEFWGGQTRRVHYGHYVPELYGMEGTAIKAIQFPGEVFTFRGMKFYMRGDALIIELPSGRPLTYHSPRLSPSTRRHGELAITYWTWNTNPKYGARGWVCMSTFGGRLTENVVQAIAHDILRHAIINLRAAGYPTVLHVYDEIVVEVPAGAGSVEEVERIMATLPAWCADWPVAAAGGWRSVRYRKG